MLIIFVCHGSICRSPAAENIFNNVIKEKGLDNKFRAISRALTNEEIGNDIYPPMKECLRRNNISFNEHHAKKLTINDIEEANYIFYMNNSNKQIIEYNYQNYLNKFHSIVEFTPSINEIEDPWYTDRYDLVVSQIQECIKNIIDNLIKD